ncbi:MAG TPA: DEAD/DEAH box helicase [Devosia sp.]|nr:DEAD/DEAH box helicase [Devosia sp.]
MTHDIPMAPGPAAIHPALAAALQARGYTSLTPVQEAVIADGHAGADLLVSAQTGSGKTVAFGLAIASTLLGHDARFGLAGLPLGLVIAPTRELALQVQRELDWLYADAGVVTTSCVGGMDARTERRALERGVHIVVGTPGRLRDHITRGALDLSGLQAVVLDEADEMLDLGFREDLEFILAAAPEERRTLMFSATVPRPIATLARTFQRDAVRVTATAATEAHADIEYQIILAQANERENAIINTLLYFDSLSTMVFCHTREAVKHLAARLHNRGFSVVALSGELTQSERTNALQAMRDGRARVCVATDVAARGIDLPNLDLVVHADVPSNPDTLLHRSGRTGRAGRKGVCALIVPVHRRGAAQRVLKAANLTATTRTAPGSAEIEEKYRQQILDGAAATLPADEVEAPLVAKLLETVPPDLLAAAYLRQQMSLRPAPEDIAAMAVPAYTERAPRAERTFEGQGEREPRRDDMKDGVWFTLSLGRKQRADPKWLLPMICKAGGVTKRDVGSIKIEDTQTRFEISADKAADYARLVAENGSGENNVTIAPASGGPERSAPYAGKKAGGAKSKWQPKFDGEARDSGPRYKVRSERGDKLGTQPVAAPAAAAEPARAPRPPKFNPKDKGKPKYKGKPAHAGDGPRPEKPKKKAGWQP